MKPFLQDDKAENPLEVVYYLIICLLVMAFLMMSVGAFLDEFEAIISDLNITLSAWGQAWLATYLGYIHWAYWIPAIFLTIVMIWGAIAVIRKATYTSAQDQQVYNPDEFV